MAILFLYILYISLFIHFYIASTFLCSSISMTTSLSRVIFSLFLYPYIAIYLLYLCIHIFLWQYYLYISLYFSINIFLCSLSISVFIHSYDNISFYNYSLYSSIFIYFCTASIFLYSPIPMTTSISVFQHFSPACQIFLNTRAPAGTNSHVHGCVQLFVTTDGATFKMSKIILF